MIIAQTELGGGVLMLPVTTRTQWPAKANAAGQWQNLQRSHPSELDQLCKGNRLSKLSAARAALSHQGCSQPQGNSSCCGEV